MNGYTNQYLVNTVNSASPEQLMLMLYDGAIRFLGMGIQAIDNKMIDQLGFPRSRGDLCQFFPVGNHIQQRRFSHI